MIDFIEYAAKEYYEGNPIISDAEFDSLVEKYSFDGVGHQVTDGLPHLYKMFSLQKVFDLSDTEEPLATGYVCTPKLDGAAVSLLYVNGLFVLGLTRGNGNIGRDVTDKLRTLVPSELLLRGTVQITGEVVCPSRVPNARNVAAGSLNLKDLEEFKTRPVRFIAYDIQGADIALWTESMEGLALQGFTVVTQFDHADYPTDGSVYRINSNERFHKMGYTSHHPRGAFALKEQKEGVVTKLLDVVWQVGKSGVVSPVAILEPVMVGEAKVGRATLHNIEYIQDLNLEIGCMVEVIRSGEIIPRILRRVAQ
jgi:NAD-dependent DNA ligase